jgi:hypothetical protein
MTTPRLLIAYIGPSGAVERVVTPATAARNWPELAADLLRALRRARDKAEERGDEHV